MTEPSTELLLDLLHDKEQEVMTGILFMVYLINAEPQYRVQPIEDEDAWRAEILQLKSTHKTIMTAMRELGELYEQSNLRPHMPTKKKLSENPSA